MRPIDTIVIHCSATPEGRPVSVATIRTWHLKRRFSDIGYHYVIDLEGRVHVGRPIGKTGAHVKGHNTGSIGICYIGGVTNDGNLSPKDTRTPAQKLAISELLHELVETYPLITEICGHRDFPGVKKACPCFDAIPEYEGILERPAAGVFIGESHDPIQPAFPSDPDMGGKPAWLSSINWAAFGTFVTSAVTAISALDPIVAGATVGVGGFLAFWIIRQRMRKAAEYGI